MHKRIGNFEELRHAVDELRVGHPVSLLAHKRIWFLTVTRHRNAPNPLTERDGNGQIWTRLAGDENYNPEAVNVALARDPCAVALSCSVGAPARWMPREARAHTASDFSNGHIEFAGVWVPDAAAIREIESAGTPTREHLVQYAHGVCDLYSRWCNGQVYAYQCHAFDASRGGFSDASEGSWENLPCIYGSSSDGYFDVRELRDDLCGSIAEQIARTGRRSSRSRDALQIAPLGHPLRCGGAVL